MDYPYEGPDDHHENDGPYWETGDWQIQLMLVEERVNELNCPNGEEVKQEYRRQSTLMVENMYLY